MIKLDARGLSCPQPVLLVKHATGGATPSLEVIVDNATAKNNICRFLKSAGYTHVTTSDMGEDTHIIGKK